jgi:predicted nicotinamide N-methyase
MLAVPASPGDHAFFSVATLNWRRNMEPASHNPAIGGGGLAAPADASAVLLADLHRQFDVVTERVAVDAFAWDFMLPRSVDDLIDEEDFERDGRLPYWAQVWPSSRALATRLAAEAGAGKRLLELGCGLGLASLVATVRGFDVLATDYYQPALDFLRLNAARNGLAPPATLLVDFRCFPAELRGFDIVAAGDVLYERANCPLVAEGFMRALAPWGLGLLADPGRLAAVDFFDECAARRLEVRLASRMLIVEAPKPHDVEVYEIRHANGPLRS